ncbi:carboxylesterase family protein [Frankia sp. CNm7]|uniref:Carboxylesterase family protein n=1 Tax=Frankia nepalensis TaxID=1836974 RepID=A0A937RHG9_9ACTN|nr:carboxylesterase family protein [Frankia nepalensis]MBL7496704.1 carboxylesterase family protein [Frankia nepalensis]MBL7511066.1 carboxylesterase family protein [Frankia nepalensis]MBL7516712.1 carboxylesterase family protein [Frankia nepalensis]MBL7627444.1 carboxylesterase family protein [Frankia nepalensis]
MTDPYLVDTPAGTLRGTPLPDGGALFAGIPFAAPPLGPRRLRPTRPPRPWPGIRDATHFRAAPPQRAPALMGADSAAASSPFGGGALSMTVDSAEDCLYLNVWTPDPTGHLPVIVWFYGGGFDVGSAAPPMTDGAALARLTGTVVVAANYRLGALGFLHLADLGGPGWEGSSNLGLQDQAAALRWVRDTIGAFGGDPGNITAAGESAGAFSVGALLTMPAAAGTFHKAILSSGSAARIFDADTGTAIATDLLTALDLREVDDLLDVPVERILETQSTVIDSDIGRRNLPGGRSWGAVHDGAVLPRRPEQAIADGVATGIGLLIGANRDEVRLFQVMQKAAFIPADEAALLAEIRQAGVTVPERLLAGYRRRAPDAGLADLRASFLTDAVYRLPASRLAAAQAAAGGRAHAYLFAAEPFGAELGAFHAADLLTLFDSLERLGAATPHLLEIRDDLTGAWARFAATGDPGWPPYEPTARPNTRQFGGNADMVTEPPDDDATAAWTQPA